MDPRVEKMAKVLVNYSVAVRPGDLVWLRYEPLAEKAAVAVYEEILKAGGNPVVQTAPPVFSESLFRLANNDQLDFLNPTLMWLTENADVRITIGAPENTRSLSNSDPVRISRLQKAQHPIMKTFMERQGTGALRWTGTRYPTEAGAQDAEMSLREYEDFVYGSMMLDRDDPVAYWLDFSNRQQRLVDWLDGKKDVQVKGENVDLTLSIEGRKFINADGKKNFPDGELFTGPVEDSVNGWVRFTYPAIYNSREVTGVELTFKDGKVVKATADKGEDFLNSVLDTDAGARYLGEFAIGTNEAIDRFTRSILFDEKLGGTIHLAVGASYPDTLAKNQSAIHWDMICDMRSGGRIIVDDQLFYENGEFRI